MTMRPPRRRHGWSYSTCCQPSQPCVDATSRTPSQRSTGPLESDLAGDIRQCGCHPPPSLGAASTTGATGSVARAGGRARERKARSTADRGRRTVSPELGGGQLRRSQLQRAANQLLVQVVAAPSVSVQVRPRWLQRREHVELRVARSVAKCGSPIRSVRPRVAVVH